MSQLNKQDLKAENQLQFPNNNNGAITPANLRAFNVDMIDSTVNQTAFDSFSGSVASEIAALSASVGGDTTQLNQYTASNDQKWNTLGAQTGSFATAAITASSLITASFDNGTRNLTFTKGDASTFAVNISDVSGSTINTASFATTGSNTFVGNQNIIGSVTASTLRVDGLNYPIADNGAKSFIQTDGGGNLSLQYVDTIWEAFYAGESVPKGTPLYFSGSQGANPIAYAADASNPAKMPVVLIAGDNITAGQTYEGIVLGLIEGLDLTGYTAGQTVYVAEGGGWSTSLPSGSNSITQVLGVVTKGGNGGKGLVLNPGPAQLPGLQTGFAWVGNSNNRPVALSTSSFAAQPFINPSVESISGSLLLTANTFTSGAANLSHISASGQNQVNLVFKNNNNAGSTIVSGSNNIYTNPAAPAATRINYVGGSNNLFLNAMPTITGSAISVSGVRPTMNSNILTNNTTWNINQAANAGTHTYSANTIQTGTLNFNTTGNTGAVTFSNNFGLNPTITLNSPSRSIAEINAGASGSNALIIATNILGAGLFAYNGPVSSSTHQISSNISVGTITLNAQSGSRAMIVGANVVVGTMQITDNTVFAPTLGSTHTFQNNLINGPTGFTNQGSSSFNATGNNLNGAQITTQLNSSAGTAAALRTSTLNGNTVFGSAQNILFSGSMAAVNPGRIFANNLMGGHLNSASLVGDGSAFSMIATTILGAGLNVMGTSTHGPLVNLYQNYGSAFFGRWNAEDGNKAKTAETVFAVGTGVSGSTGIKRKTGFLIDSGSNTFVEGTLNVSGSMFLNGSQFNRLSGQTFYATVSQSGSANVSQSIQFDATGSGAGINLVSGSQLQVENAGLYSINVDAHWVIDLFGGDTVNLWIMKNGSNIANSAQRQNYNGSLNIVDQANANDYYEVVWEGVLGDAVLRGYAASGGSPTVPAAIATITEIN